MNKIKPFNRYDSSKIFDDDIDLPLIKDEVIAKILFLSTEPEQKCLQNGGGSASSIRKLLEKFMMALCKKSINPIRRALETRLRVLKNYSGNDRYSILEKNFSDVEDILSEEEEDILELNEIFQMLSIKVPQFLREKFKVLVEKKKIPVPKNEVGHEFKTFFVYTENKVLSQICDMLNPSDVCRIYSSVKENKEGREEFSEVVIIDLEEKSLQEIPGLKDVAFYYLALQMMDHQLLNRLHTHALEYFLQLVIRNCKAENSKDLLRFEKSLKMLRRYPVSSHPPGFCVIFSMDEGREGAKDDVIIVKDLFENKYLYDVLVINNPTSKDIQTFASKLQAPRNKFYDSLVVWFMGHGSLNELIVMDRPIDRRKEFIHPLSNIDWLNKKPKLFFIQACSIDPLEGSSAEGKHEATGLAGETDSVSFGIGAGSGWRRTYGSYMDTSCINSYADTLIAYATKWYEPASRHGKGSLYVQTVVDQLKEHGHIESIENVLRKIHYNTNIVLLLNGCKTWKQTPYYECSFQKEFVFPLAEEFGNLNS